MEDADGHCNLGSGSKLKGFRTDQGAKILPQDSGSRMENSKRKVSPAMLASRTSTSKRSQASSALKAANKYKPQYPSFKVVIRPHNLLGHNVVREEPEILVLNIQGAFFKGRINGSMQAATLKHLDGSWPVKLLYYPQHGSGKLSAGWGAFQKGISLKEGDVCVFELVRNDDIEFKVSIFRRNVET
ncbi:B3 domain-containing transcription factor VRN1-like [Rhodamnia argentea]|uniref:B3 domain-containing transcription factor VRN1-like n=1 Tax=Rhodamnia argentea TaxID=178133 RepID=A0ABM3HG65_9MYRT|nr:B3 domain-containing transcription factor VRN1-like [Rhodamnia argentea]